ncbi:MAG: carbohydrate-binding protein [Clostridium sp.]|uniref:carbohydrate-binding protein n=1 Tax=Clostridium sp. TaxID=1506 RepID=UPI003F3724BC
MRRGLILLGLIVVSFFSVGCGSKEVEENEKPQIEVEEEAFKESNIIFEEKNDFLVLKSEVEGDIKFVLKEFDKVVADGTISKGNESKIYSLANCKKDMAYDYTLELVMGDKKIVKALNYAKVKTDGNSDITGEELYEWNKNGKEYKEGDKVIYKEARYKCLQAHTSQEAWNPREAVSLWQEDKN